MKKAARNATKGSSNKVSYGEGYDEYYLPNVNISSKLDTKGTGSSKKSSSKNDKATNAKNVAKARAANDEAINKKNIEKFNAANSKAANAENMAKARAANDEATYRRNVAKLNAENEANAKRQSTIDEATNNRNIAKAKAETNKKNASSKSSSTGLSAQSASKSSKGAAKSKAKASSRKSSKSTANDYDLLGKNTMVDYSKYPAVRSNNRTSNVTGLFSKNPTSLRSTMDSALRRQLNTPWQSASSQNPRTMRFVR